MGQPRLGRLLARSPVAVCLPKLYSRSHFFLALLGPGSERVQGSLRSVGETGHGREFVKQFLENFLENLTYLPESFYEEFTNNGVRLFEFVKLKVKALAISKNKFSSSSPYPPPYPYTIIFITNYAEKV
jgi:hypothetical protein